MSILRLILHGALAALLLAGAADAIGLALGGGTPRQWLARGFVLAAVGWGARHEGALHPPGRASYLWLGLAGGLPLLAGWAPWSGLAAVLLVLPLRVLGARLGAALAEDRRAAGALVGGAAFGILTVTVTGLGPIGYVTTWALLGVMQLFAPRPASADASGGEASPGEPAWWWPPALLGAGLAALAVFLAPYPDLFDSSAAIPDARRVLVLAALFLLTWVTAGAALAEWRFHALAAAVATAVLAALLPWTAARVGVLGTRDGYASVIASTRLRAWTGSDAPYLSEEHPVYAMALALVMLALPVALAAVAVRAAGGRHPRGPRLLGPLLAGAGALWIAAGVLPVTWTAAGAGVTSAALLFLAAAAIAWHRLEGTPQRVAALAVAGVAAGLTLRVPERPAVGLPLRDAWTWELRRGTDGRPWQETGVASVVRVLERQRGDSESLDFVADGRNLMSPQQDGHAAWMRESVFAAALAARAERALLVGTPHGPSLAALGQAGFRELVHACDPPALLRMAERASAMPVPASTAVRTVSQADGPFDLVLLRGAAQWDARHHLLRPELLAQARPRLADGGVVAYACSPDQLVPGLLPAWVSAFRRAFDQVDVWVLPWTLRLPRIVITGRDAGAEPAPTPGILALLQRLDLPMSGAGSWESLRAGAGDLLGAPSLLQGPLRPSVPLLAPTEYKLIDEHRSLRRAEEVLAELHEGAAEEHRGLGAFYLGQLAAQEYSVHDTFLVKNPYAVEMSEEALESLLALTRAHPDAGPLHALWAEVGRGLVEQREVGWAGHYFGILFEELGWREKEVRLVLAHAALEMLDEEEALRQLESALRSEPGWAPAAELERLIESGEGVERDPHAGHDHD